MLLIVTNKSDLTSDYLIIRLEELKIPFCRLNTEDYLSKYQIEINFSNNSLSSYINFFDGGKINIDEITGVYFKHPMKPNIKCDIPVNQISFAEREIIEMLRSLFRLIDKKLWLNHPKYIFSANNKIEQLKLASKIGFNIPKTCISSDPDVIRRFYYSNNEDIIAKAVKYGHDITNNHLQFAPTKKVEKKFIENIENYYTIPTIYQEKIEKKYDIRVTVVGNKVYTSAIHSQEHNETMIDWRLWDIHNNVDLKHSKHELPSKISNLCLKITKKFNLRFSAIDLIFTPEKKYYFLEMNPNGQWAWIEGKLGYPIRDSIINCLGCYGD